MLHEDSHHHVDQHELGHQHEHHEVDRRYYGTDTAVGQTLVGTVAVLTQRVLHDAVPVVTRGNPEQGQEGHAEVAEVSMFTKALAGMLFRTLWILKKYYKQELFTLFIDFQICENYTLNIK